MTIKEIENNLPSGFHDASLKRIDIDYEKKVAILDIEIDVGNPEAQEEKLKEIYRAARLTLTGLILCVIEPPDLQYTNLYIEGLWITGSASIDCEKTSIKLPQSLPEGAFVHQFYISNWNASIYLAAMSALFDWS